MEKEMLELQEIAIREKDDKKTVLHIASLQGSIEKVHYILRKFSDKNYLVQTDSNGETALHVAAYCGHSEVVKILIDEAICLPAAATLGDDDHRGPIRCFQDFIRHPNSNLDTALHLAVKGKHLDVVDLILEADPTYPHQDKNRDSKTPIFIAAEKGYKDIVLRTAKFGYETLGPENQTALHAAIRGRYTDCVRALLAKAPRLVTYGDQKGWTALHYAAYYKYDSILDDILDVQEDLVGGYQVSIIEHSSGSESRVPLGQSVGMMKVATPLCIAAQEGHVSTLIKLMLSLPHLCAHVNNEDQNILHIAAGKNIKEMVKCILTYCPGDDYTTSRILNQKDVNGDTPLHLLIKHGCFVPQLINHKDVDTMARNNRNWTPFDMLYLDEDIIADQLQIKKAVDIRAHHHNWKFWNRNTKVIYSRRQSETQAHQTWKSRRRSTRGNSDTQESVVPTSIRSRKDGRFKIEQKRLMKIELSYHKQRLYAQMIVTVLIATVTFTVGFTLPGGYHQSGEPDEGLVLLSKKTAFNVFMIADALSLVLSTSSLFIFFIMNMHHDPLKVSMLTGVSTAFNLAAVIAMMLTFMMGTYVVLSHSQVLAMTVCAIICSFFLLVIVLLGHMIYSRNDPEFDKSEV